MENPAILNKKKKKKKKKKKNTTMWLVQVDLI